MSKNELEYELTLPVPYTLKSLGNATWIAEWNPAIKSDGLPDIVIGRSRTSPLNAVRRLRDALVEAGVIK